MILAGLAPLSGPGRPAKPARRGTIAEARGGQHYRSKDCKTGAVDASRHRSRSHGIRLVLVSQLATTVLLLSLSISKIISQKDYETRLQYIESVLRDCER